jgi:hypothetical protein
MNRPGLRITLALALVSGAAAAELPPPPALTDRDARGNWFVQALHALHLASVEGREVRTTRATGGYAGEPGYFEEVSHHDAKSGRLLSTIQWETAQPERIHSIEVYRYDERGRLARRYTAWYMPHRRAAPRATWISFHAEHQDLRAYRQFDASDTLVSEVCEGRYRGRAVNISLWEEGEVAAARSDPKGVMSTPEYRACFAGLPLKSAGKYLIPQ